MNIAGHLPILVIIIPLISAVFIPLLGRINRSAVCYFVLSVTFLSFLISISLLSMVMTSGRISYRLGGWEPPWGIEYVVDYLSGFVLTVVSFISFIVSIYSKRSVEKEIDGSKIPAFYCVYMLFITGLMGIVITGDIFNLYVFIEISALSAYVLIAMGKKKAALLASYNYLILGTIAATFILLGIGHLYMATGSLNMADLSKRLPALYGSHVVRTAFVFFTIGLSLKMALYPLHIWLPDAHSTAPSVISALLAAAALKVGAYALLRVVFTVFTVDFVQNVVPATKVFLVLAVLAIIAGSVLTIAQTNIKRMLAYSSIGQMGYIVLGAAIMNPIAMTGSLIHILNHALMKSTLFLVAGSILYKTGIEDISGLKGMGKRMPYTMAAFTIGALSMIGAPLTVGFVSKWYLAIGALRANMWYIIPVILLSSLLTAVYCWRIIETIYFHKAPEDEIMMTYNGHSTVVNDAPAGMTVPTLVLAGLCIVLGFAAFIPVTVVTSAANMLLGAN